MRSASVSAVIRRGPARTSFSSRLPCRGRKPLNTLRDAALYIAKLPKAEHEAEQWQAAMQALLLVVEHDGPTMLARIGVMRR